MAEELLPWDGVVVSGRNVTRDFEYMGRHLKQGQQVVLINRAADRDPRGFDNPEAVDFERSGVRTLALRGRPHRCVGSHLARLELGVVHARIPTYRLKEGTKVVSHGGNVAGVEELWLSWDT